MSRKRSVILSGLSSLGPGVDSLELLLLASLDTGETLELLRALLASGVVSLELLPLLRLISGCSSFRLVVDGGLRGMGGFGSKTGFGTVEGFENFFGGGSGF